MIVTYKKESTRKDTIMSKIDELIELLKFNKGEAMRREKKNKNNKKKEKLLLRRIKKNQKKQQ